MALPTRLKRNTYKPHLVPFPGRIEAAVMNGQLDEIATQLASGINPNYRAPHFGDLLAIAAKWGQLEALNLLLDAGARTDATTTDSTTAFNHVVHLGRIDMVQALLAHGFDMNPLNSHRFQPPVLTAILAEQADMLRWLCQHGSPVEVFDDTGRTPLMLAARIGSADCVRICLDFGAHINAQDSIWGLTPAMFSTSSPPEIMAALCEYGFDITIQNKMGHTIEHLIQLRLSSPQELVYRAWRLSMDEQAVLSQSTARASFLMVKPAVPRI